MLDILLVNPPLSYSTDSRNIQDDVFKHHPPLGYLYLASVLRNNDFTVEVINTLDKLSLTETIEIVKKKKPKVIGISAMTANMRGAYQFARRVKKEIKPNPVIILGGHHISCDPGVINRYSCFDIGVTGEGEITLPLLLNRIIRLNKKVKKMVYKGVLPSDLDKIPEPARDLIDYKRLSCGSPISMISSRGCPYNCIFCSRPAISKTVRYRSPVFVVREMVKVFKMSGNREFVFQDDTFNMNSKHVIGICNEIIKSGHKINWTAYGRFNLVDEKTIKAMAKAGCKKLMFGVESGNERVRNEIVKKAVTDKQIKIGIHLCWKYNIEPDIFLMLGFPTETKEEINDTINFGKNFLPNMLGAHITTPFPGSYLWNEMVKRKEINPSIIDDYIQGKMGEDFGKAWPKYIPEGMTINDLNIASANAHKYFYLSIRYILKRLSRDFTSWKRIKEDIRQAYSIYRCGQSYAKS